MSTIVLVILINNSIAMYDMESHTQCMEMKQTATTRLSKRYKPESFHVQCLYKLGGFVKQS